MEAPYCKVDEPCLNYGMDIRRIIILEVMAAYMAVISMWYYDLFDRLFTNQLTFVFSIAMFGIGTACMLTTAYPTVFKRFRNWNFWSEIIVSMGLLGTVLGVAGAIAKINFGAIAGGNVAGLDEFKTFMLFGFDTTIVGVVIVIAVSISKAVHDELS